MLLLATLGAVTLAANTLGSTRQVPEFFPRLRIPYAPASFSSSHRGAAAVTILVGFKGVCGDSTRVQYHSRIPGYTHGARGPLYGSQTTLSTNRTFSVRLYSSLFVQTRDGALVLGVTLCCTLHGPRERRRAFQQPTRQALRFSVSALGVEGTVQKGTYLAIV